MSNNEFELLIRENAQIIENELAKYMNSKNDNGLCELMSYSLLGAGKRIRPFIVIEASKLFSGKDFNIKRVLPYACALEMIHTYSLIHDDLPSMDNDDYRRGKLTSHKVFGEGKALLAGDTLLTYAFEVLASNELVSDKSVRYATIALSKYAGFAGMAGGQMIDLNSGENISSFDELKKMHSLKTSALIKCAMVLGYLSACDTPNDKVISDLEAFSDNIGIAFQIKDDILDKTSDSVTLGKPVGSDDKNGKATTLSYMSIDEAQKQVDDLTNDAIKIIEAYYEGICGMHSLVDLAKYMVDRKK